MVESRRVLLLLGQLPHDPASGAARSMRGIAELLAADARFDVRCLATTATERATALDPIRWLRQSGRSVQIDRRGAIGRGCPTVAFEDRRVAYTLLDTRGGPDDWRGPHERQLDRMLEAAMGSFRPDVVLTFGGADGDRRRRRLAREGGAIVVFGLRNHGYYEMSAFGDVDAVLTPCDYLTRSYRERIGLISTAIPSPIELEETMAPQREPIFFTYVNPAPFKGITLVARLAEELGRRRPDIPLLVVESRGTAGALVQLGLKAGFDLRRHENIMFSPGTPFPRDIFEATRVLLFPAVGDEPFGRTAAEALLNGVPPIVTDRGGLPETVGEGGIVLPLPASVTVESAAPVERDVVEPWMNEIERLTDDETAYDGASARALAAADRYRPEQVGPQYLAFFETVQRIEGSVIDPTLRRA